LKTLVGTPWRSCPASIAKPEQQQCVAEEARDAAPLAPAEPDQAGSFERPGAGRAARVERERDHERQEHRADRERALERHLQAGPRPQRQGQQHIDRRQHQRGQGHAVLGIAHQAVLQRERDRRQAEQQAAIDPTVDTLRDVAAWRRSHAPRRHQHDRDEQHEERDQERLAGCVAIGPIVEHAPCRRDEEGRDEADQVQRAPGPVPGHQRDAEVEHEVVAEQRDIVAATARDQQRRREAAERADHGERAGVLQDGERGGKGGHHDHQRERRSDREHVVELEGGEERQVQHRDRPALQDLRVLCASRAQPPTEHQQHEGDATDPGEAELDRHLHMLARVLRKEGKADEQNAHACLDDRVAAE